MTSMLEEQSIITLDWSDKGPLQRKPATCHREVTIWHIRNSECSIAGCLMALGQDYGTSWIRNTQPSLGLPYSSSDCVFAALLVSILS